MGATNTQWGDAGPPVDSTMFECPDCGMARPRSGVAPCANPECGSRAGRPPTEPLAAYAAGTGAALGREEQHAAMMKAFDTFARPYLPPEIPRAVHTVRGKLLTKLRAVLEATKP